MFFVINILPYNGQKSILLGGILPLFLAKYVDLVIFAQMQQMLILPKASTKPQAHGVNGQCFVKMFVHLAKIFTQHLEYYRQKCYTTL